MQKITPFLWFDDKAEEAMNFYVSIFKNSKILSTARYGEAGPGPKGTVMTAEFQLEGQEFVALNGGPHFKFTEAISFVVNCETRSRITMRLAQRQIWPVVASRSHCLSRAVPGQRRGEIAKGHESNASNEKDGHRQVETGGRAGMNDSLSERERKQRMTTK